MSLAFLAMYGSSFDFSTLRFSDKVTVHVVCAWSGCRSSVWLGTIVAVRVFRMVENVFVGSRGSNCREDVGCAGLVDHKAVRDHQCTNISCGLRKMLWE